MPDAIDPLPPCPVCGGTMDGPAEPYMACACIECCGYEVSTQEQHRALCARLERGNAAIAELELMKSVLEEMGRKECKNFDSCKEYIGINETYCVECTKAGAEYRL